MPQLYLTAALPYVNGDPHLGHALEYVQVDVLARHARARGRAVRLHSGTDDHALKNVQAAERASQEAGAFVAERGARFRALAEALDVGFDDFLHTSTDPRHAPVVRELWRRIAAAGDLYEHEYDGLYCDGCEQFVTPDELTADGTCGEHGAPPSHVRERNW